MPDPARRERQPARRAHEPSELEDRPGWDGVGDLDHEAAVAAFFEQAQRSAAQRAGEVFGRCPILTNSDVERIARRELPLLDEL